MAAATHCFASVQHVSGSYGARSARSERSSLTTAFLPCFSRSSGVRRAGNSARGVESARAAVAVEAQESAIDLAKLNEEFETASPFEIMDTALRLYGDDIAIAFSGAEDVALIEYAKLTGRPFRVFSLDTGRLNAETYQFFDKVEKHYGIRIEYMFPDSTAVENLVREKGLFSFYEDGHNECCRIRKVQPLRRALKGLRAWITGQRKDQSPGTRAQVPFAQVDPAFEGMDGGPGSLSKFNPLANVSSLAVWDFLRTMEVPVNELHAKGFISIGCEPCTKAVLPNQHEREGRWWWEDATAKECGLHKAGNDSGSTNGSGAAAEPDLGYSSSVEKQGGSTVRDLFLDEAVVALSRPDIEKVALSSVPREQSWLVVLYAPWCPYCQAMEESFEEVARNLAGSDVKVGKFQADKEHKEFSKENLQLKSFPTILFLPKNSTAIVKRPSERRDVHSLTTWVQALK